ncbi:MAG: haloacid dehalogenase type II [Burkholderiaceae bacterium]|nr:haloacid dehalogenase type II [Burkholderiaceae bacterium]MCD8517173.1 haloacid dehalogenase type II [Burkholderiaceae bacterium]MCD8536439.1 haloacid dehalogenase type II [Burkholderiaceae bacterium]MCD8565281.1 haloacid dehalogenase type II [Burkholderiaceae bacterium]
MSIKAVVFDAYGTLFDVYSVTTRLESFCPGQGSAIAQLWRDKQLEYSRLISLSDSNHGGSRYYETFWAITCKALDYALQRFGQTLNEVQIQSVLDQYHALDAFAENAEVLIALKQKGVTTAILSNGDPSMLNGAVAGAGFNTLIDHVLSVDEVRHFKTTPHAYGLAQQHMGFTPAEVLFVSSNGWDVLGAQWFGFRVCWINRAGLPAETLGPEPEFQGANLEVVIKVLETLA